MSQGLPKRGTITLEHGELVARGDDGDILGRFYVSARGMVYEGELTIFQANDPPKLRLCGSYDSGQGHLGCVSFNILRDGEPDVQEEVAYLGGTTGEGPGSAGQYQGQVEVRVRGTNQGEPQLALKISDSYTQAEYGTAITRCYVKDPVTNLWKWSY